MACFRVVCGTVLRGVLHGFAWRVVCTELRGLVCDGAVLYRVWYVFAWGRVRFRVVYRERCGFTWRVVRFCVVIYIVPVAWYVRIAVGRWVPGIVQGTGVCRGHPRR